MPGFSICRAAAEAWYNPITIRAQHRVIVQTITTKSIHQANKEQT